MSKAKQTSTLQLTVHIHHLFAEWQVK